MNDSSRIDLITGAGGFTARHLARRLRGVSGVPIFGIGMSSSVRNSYLDSYAACDLRDKKSITQVVKELRPKRVFHLAGRAKGSAGDLFSTNVVGTILLIEALREYCPDVEILLVGSAAEYGAVDPLRLPITEDEPCNPVGLYGISKNAMTNVGIDYNNRYGMKIVVARPFNIIGPGMSEDLLLGALLRRIKLSVESGVWSPIEVGNLDTERDFVSVEDAVDAYISMISGGFWGEVFNVSSGVGIPVRSLLDVLASVISTPIRFEVRASLVRPNDVRVSYGSHQKATDWFGFRPTISLASLLQRSWEDLPSSFSKSS